MSLARDYRETGKRLVRATVFITLLLWTAGSFAWLAVMWFFSLFFDGLASIAIMLAPLLLWRVGSWATCLSIWMAAIIGATVHPTSVWLDVLLLAPSAVLTMRYTLPLGPLVKPRPRFRWSDHITSQGIPASSAAAPPNSP